VKDNMDDSMSNISREVNT